MKGITVISKHPMKVQLKPEELLNELNDRVKDLGIKFDDVKYTELDMQKERVRVFGTLNYGQIIEA